MYMSLFIAQENQQLLYEMIHKTPNIRAVFPEGSSEQVEEKNAWFRGVIENFYQQISGPITREQLKTINRTALGYMVTQLQQRTASSTIPNKVPPFNTLKREHAPEYESREAQYKSLFDTPKQYAPLPVAHDNISVKIMQDVPKEELQPTVINEKKVQFDIPEIKDVSSDIIEGLHKKIDAMESKLNQIFEFIMKKETKESLVDVIKNQMNTLSDEL